MRLFRKLLARITGDSWTPCGACGEFIAGRELPIPWDRLPDVVCRKNGRSYAVCRACTERALADNKPPVYLEPGCFR